MNLKNLLNPKNLLKLLGFDGKQPFGALLSLLKLLYTDRIHEEIEQYLKTKVTRGRRLDLAVKLREAAIELEADNLGKAGVKLAAILQSIKL